MIEKLRELNKINNLLDRLAGFSLEIQKREIFGHGDEYTWVICGERFGRDEFVIIQKEHQDKYEVYYSMDHDACLRANHINDAMCNGFVATVHRGYDNRAECILENYVENQGFCIDFTGLRTRDHWALPESSFNRNELERMCNETMYGYGTTTGYTYTYHSPSVSIRNNINDHIAQVSNSAEIQIGSDGVKLNDTCGTHHVIATAADMLAIFGNPLVNEILNYANTPSNDPIERLVRGRILEIFNNATHLGGER